MRNLGGKLAVVVIAIGWILSPPAIAGSTTQTCTGWSECVILRYVCNKHGGSYGEVIDPSDASVWGICVI